MIDTDTEYRHLKERCNNAVYQYTSFRPDVTERIGLPQWAFSEEYALIHDDFRLYWHSPKEALYCEAKLNPLNNVLTIEVRKEGLNVLELLQHKEIQLEHIRNRMFYINVYMGIHGQNINISWFDDPEYVLWSVRYTDPDNNVRHVTARARTKNEAKAIAWADSPYHEETIRPEMYTVTPYEPHELTMANSKAYLAVLLSQADICDRYDRQAEATKPDLPAV